VLIFCECARLCRIPLKLSMVLLELKGLNDVTK
jgi:hypothetical protein